MRTLEALNRILVGVLLFLVFIQAGLLLAMKNMKDQAQVRLVDNETKADLECGRDSFLEENYWNPLEKNVNFVKKCETAECEKASLYWQDNGDKTYLHVVSVKTAPPMRWDQQDAGGVIKVRVSASEKPQVLALVSQSMHEWRLIVDKQAHLEKVVVATPTVVWLEGVPEGVKIEYLPKQKMCSYPYTWEEIYNPDNEFRTLLGALKKVTGLETSSFQGAILGREFVLPKGEELLRRQIASIDGSDKKGEDKSAHVQSPVSWERQADRVVAKSIVLPDDTEIELPEKTAAVVGENENKLFVINHYRLQTWNDDTKKFVNVEAPLYLPSIEDLTAMALDPSNPSGGVFLFNERRGGELYYYDKGQDQWTLLTSGISGMIRTLYYAEKEQKLYGLVERARAFSELYVFARTGELQEKKPLTAKIPVDSIRWRWQMAKDEGRLTLWMHTPLVPAGHEFQIPY